MVAEHQRCVCVLCVCAGLASLHDANGTSVCKPVVGCFVASGSCPLNPPRNSSFSLIGDTRAARGPRHVARVPHGGTPFAAPRCSSAEELALQ